MLRFLEKLSRLTRLTKVLVRRKDRGFTAFRHGLIALDIYSDCETLVMEGLFETEKVHLSAQSQLQVNSMELDKPRRYPCVSCAKESNSYRMILPDFQGLIIEEFVNRIFRGDQLRPCIRVSH